MQIVESNALLFNSRKIFGWRENLEDGEDQEASRNPVNWPCLDATKQILLDILH